MFVMQYRNVTRDCL